jgi:PAS domain S-box-containing protein
MIEATALPGARPPEDAYPAFPGAGEMATLCRRLDWAATPLGPVESWPAALRWAVRTVLESPFPINLWCGPELVLIYNDGYRHVLGSKHPASLGRSGKEVWGEIWGQIAPMFQQIREGGPAVYADDAPFVIEGRDAPADRGEGETNAWFTFSLSPVRDEGGRVVAFLNVVSETTRRILAERATQAARREAEAAEARLRDVFAQAPAFLAVLRGPDFVFEFVNEAYYQLVGHRELLGRPVFEALPEVRGQGFEELLARVRDTGEPFVGREVSFLVTRTPGAPPEQRFVDLVYYPLTEADGTRSGVVAHGSDVTGQVLARQAVERLEERLRTALESADIGTWDFDPVAGVLSWDERCRRMFGLAPDDPVDYARFESLVHPDDLALTNAAVAGALDPAGDGTYAVEYRAVLPGGGVRWVRASGRAFFAGEGAERHSARFIGTVIDISERRAGEAERERLLHEAQLQRERLEQIFAEAPAVMALYTGPEHVVTLVNPTWEQTVGKPGAVGRRFRDVFPEFEGTGLFELLDETYRTGRPFVDPEVNVPLERWGSGVTESTYWHLVWRPLAGGDPGRRDVLVHAVEVTEQVRARQEVEAKAEELARLAAALEASNRELDQFAYVASHDLKAPLRGISNLSQWIEDDLADRFTDESREHMALLRGRVHRMEGLIDGILRYSRAGRVRDPAERVDTGALVREIVDLLAPPAGATVGVAGAMPVLVTERLPLQQVLMNLVGNALKYGGGAAARVEVSARRDAQGEWELAVRDHGPGIAPEYRERIFGIFQTLEPRDRVESTGIGLSIVKKLVEGRGGRVWVDEAPGGGALFRFTWPESAGAEGG